MQCVIFPVSNRVRWIQRGRGQVTCSQPGIVPFKKFCLTTVIKCLLFCSQTIHFTSLLCPWPLNLTFTFPSPCLWVWAPFLVSVCWDVYSFWTREGVCGRLKGHSRHVKICERVSLFTSTELISLIRTDVLHRKEISPMLSTTTNFNTIQQWRNELFQLWLTWIYLLQTITEGIMHKNTAFLRDMDST